MRDLLFVVRTLSLLESGGSNVEIWLVERNNRNRSSREGRCSSVDIGIHIRTGYARTAHGKIALLLRQRKQTWGIMKNVLEVILKLTLRRSLSSTSSDSSFIFRRLRNLRVSSLNFSFSSSSDCSTSISCFLDAVGRILDISW